MLPENTVITRVTCDHATCDMPANTLALTVNTSGRYIRYLQQHGALGTGKRKHLLRNSGIICCTKAAARGGQGARTAQHSPPTQQP